MIENIDIRLSKVVLGCKEKGVFVAIAIPFSSSLTSFYIHGDDDLKNTPIGIVKYLSTHRQRGC